MRKSRYLLVILLITGLSVSGFAAKGGSSSKIKLRPMLGFGLSLVGNSAAEAYPGTSMDRSILNYGLAFQTLVEVSETASVGVELGYFHILTEKDTTGAAHPLNTNTGSNKYNLSYYNMLAFVELHLSKMFFIQTGLGMAMKSGDESNGGVTPIFMIAPGAEIELSSSMSIPIMLRITAGEMASGSKLYSVVPVTILGGITLKI